MIGCLTETTTCVVAKPLVLYIVFSSFSFFDVILSEGNSFLTISNTKSSLMRLE